MATAPASGAGFWRRSIALALPDNGDAKGLGTFSYNGDLADLLLHTSLTGVKASCNGGAFGRRAVKFTNWFGSQMTEPSKPPGQSFTSEVIRPDRPVSPITFGRR